MKFPTQRHYLIHFAKEMNQSGLSRGASGNLSVRVEGGLLITPSAMKPADYAPDDIVFISLDPDEEDGGEPSFSGAKAPSSEWRFHRDIYREFPKAKAVLHAHSLWATTLSCLGKDIPAFHYMIAVAGGKTIRCAPYATFGTEALSQNALMALTDRKACLLANHGLLCFDESLDAVFELANDVEELCQQYTLALQAGEPVILSDEEMDVVLARFSDYLSANKE